MVEASWRDRLRLKYGFNPETASVNQPRVGYAVRWKQPVGADWNSGIEFGHKDRRDSGPSYNWSMFELARPIGRSMLRY